MLKLSTSQLLRVVHTFPFIAAPCSTPALRTLTNAACKHHRIVLPFQLHRVMSSSSSSLPPLHRGKPSTSSSQPARSPPPSHSPSSSLPLTPTSLSPSSSSPPLLQPPTTFFCYLLRSLSPRHHAHTYIGFTTSPLRRLRQHNGDITAGAWRTSKKRPWEVVAVVYGFTSKVVALQFEWQWTYPTKSKRMRTVMGLRRWGGGVRGKVEVMYQLLCSAPWHAMPLHVRFTTDDGWKVHEVIMKRSDKEAKDWAKHARTETEEERAASHQRRHIYALPPHVTVTVGPLDELDYYRWLGQRRGRQKRREEANALDDAGLCVTPGGDDGLSIYDDDAAVSGEESLNSGASDGERVDTKADAVLSDDDDDVVLESPDVHSRAAKLPRASPPEASREVEARGGLQGSSGAARLRCQVCFGLAELGDPRSRRFFSGCDQCAFVGHLACMAQLIFKQMEGAQSSKASTDPHAFLSTQPTAPYPPPSFSSSSTSALSPLQRSTSSSPLSPAASPSSSSLLSSVSSSLPLLPPPSTGSCPSCHSTWSWPCVVERCRFMHTDSRGRRGGDVWYQDAEQFSMAAFVQQWAGRAGEDKVKQKEEEKRERLEQKEQRKRDKQEAAERRAKEKADHQAIDAVGKTKERTPAVRTKARRRSDDSGSEASSGVLDSDDSGMKAKKGRKGRKADKENEDDDGRERAPAAKKRAAPAPPVSRRVEMVDRPPSLPSLSSAVTFTSTSTSFASPSTSLFASSQPLRPASSSSSPTSLSASQPPPRAPLDSVVTLSDFEDDEDVGDLAATVRRRRLLAEAAERRLGRSGGAAPPAVPTEMKAELGPSGREGKQAVGAGREWVHLDDDAEEVEEESS